MTTLSLEGAQIAIGRDGRWERQWCALAQRDNGAWDIGDAHAALLPPARSERADNRYTENLEAGGKFSPLELFCLHLGELIGFGNQAIDIAAGAFLDDDRAARALGVIEALGHKPRFILPRALLAARGQPEGTLRVLEIGRDRSFVSTVTVSEASVRLEKVEPVAAVSLCGLLEQWFEQVTTAFASEHRFNLLHNLGENRKQLYAQLCAADAEADMSLECDGHRIRLAYQHYALPLPSWLEDDVPLRVLPLPEPLPFTARTFNLDAAAAPGPAAIEEVAGQLEAGPTARRFDELPV